MNGEEKARKRGNPFVGAKNGSFSRVAALSVRFIRTGFIINSIVRTGEWFYTYIGQTITKDDRLPFNGAPIPLITSRRVSRPSDASIRVLRIRIERRLSPRDRHHAVQETFSFEPLRK